MVNYSIVAALPQTSSSSLVSWTPPQKLKSNLETSMQQKISVCSSHSAQHYDEHLLVVTLVIVPHFPCLHFSVLGSSTRNKNTDKQSLMTFLRSSHRPIVEDNKLLFLARVLSTVTEKISDVRLKCAVQKFIWKVTN